MLMTRTPPLTQQLTCTNEALAGTIVQLWLPKIIGRFTGVRWQIAIGVAFPYLLAFAAMRGLCAETVLIARACDFVFLAEGGG